MKNEEHFMNDDYIEAVKNEIRAEGGSYVGAVFMMFTEKQDGDNIELICRGRSEGCWGPDFANNAREILAELVGHELHPDCKTISHEGLSYRIDEEEL